MFAIFDASNGMSAGASGRFRWLYAFPAIGVLLLSAAGFFGWKHYRFIATAPQYTAKVVDLRWQSKAYYPVFEFRDNGGNSVRAAGSMGASPPMFEIGETVEILYDEQGCEAVARGFFSEWAPVLIIGFIGTVFTGVGMVFVRVFRRAVL